MIVRKKYTIISIWVLVALVIALIIACSRSITTIYIVRHADKDTTFAGDNPPLSAAGLIRAQELADLLSHNDIAAIYSTNFLRTISTARPVSDLSGVPITIYSVGANPVALSSLPLQGTKSILIVGHTSTILDLFRELGCGSARTVIPETDFDNLLIVRKYRYFIFSWTSCEETTYGAPTPP